MSKAEISTEFHSRAASVRFEGVAKHYGTVVAVRDVSFDVPAGSLCTLLGPSGCGKTTTLRLIAGLEMATHGRIFIGDENVTALPATNRDVSMVFQSYAVFPHMKVFDNVAYGLKVTGVAKDEIRERVDEALGLVQLEGFGNRKPDQLSGGQRQRVALARALVKRPRVLLLDEPLSALDAKLRAAMQLELARLQHTVGITFIIVTHDQDEALSMADRVAVMEAGVVRQIAPPGELYEYPTSRFVADFIGKMNLFEGRVGATRDGTLSVSIEGLGEVDVPYEGELAGEIGIAIRPEKLRITRDKPSEPCIAFPGALENVADHGSESHVFCTTDTGIQLTATIQNETRTKAPLVQGDRLWVSWIPGDTLVLVE